MKKIKKAKKVKKIKTKSLMATVKKHVGRPKKVKTAKVGKVGRPKNKVGRPRKVKIAKESKKEKLQKIAKLGKRKYNAAVEKMAVEKINKKVKRKGNGVTHNNNENSKIEKVIGSRTYSYESQSRICAGPNTAAVGIEESEKKKLSKESNSNKSFLDKIKKRLHEKGYRWKDSTFKVTQKNSDYWVVKFFDKKQGEVISLNSIDQYQQEQKIEKENIDAKIEKTPKLPKVELNQYIKKLTARGLRPNNIKVLENTKDYFKIEFNDGDNTSLTTCSHVKSWGEV